jgi:hypothetical protein
MIFALALVLSQAPAVSDAADAGAAVAPASDAPVANAGAAEAPLTPPPQLEADAEHLAPSHGFVKGELSVYLGSDRLSVKRNRIGVSAGVDFFKDAYYVLVEPQVDLRFFDAKLGIGVGVPLRIEVFNFNDYPDKPEVIGFGQAGRLRKEDYATYHDYGRLLKYINWGRKEDNLYINIGQRYATSIGHGAVMRRYAPNIDVDYPRASAEVDAYNDYAGFEAFTNDVLRWDVMAAIAFVKPLSFFKPDNLIARTLSFGVTGAVDRDAPTALVYDPSNGTRQLTTEGRLAAKVAPLGIVGFDAEAKIVKTDSVDIKPYVDYSMMLGGDGGLTVGALGRFNLGSSTVNAFRVVLEGRYLGNHYVPSYFDTFYEIDRFQYRNVGVNPYGQIQYDTKSAYVLQQGFGNRAGFYAEASYGIQGKIGFTVAVEAAANSPTNFVAHLEIPWLDFLQIFGSYYKRNLTGFNDFAVVNQNTVIFAGARLKILPFLFINGRVYQTFRLDIGSYNAADPMGQMPTGLNRYTNQFGFSIDLEIGYEFGRSRVEAEEIQKAAPPSPVSEPTPAQPEQPAPAEQAPPPPSEQQPPPAPAPEPAPAPAP